MITIAKPANHRKAKVIKAAKRILRGAAQILRAEGLTYEQIEEELDLRPAHGMTAWRAVGNIHKKPVASPGKKRLAALKN